MSSVHVRDIQSEKVVLLAKQECPLQAMLYFQSARSICLRCRMLQAKRGLLVQLRRMGRTFHGPVPGSNAFQS